MRIVTIADIFAALIEERSYRQSLPATVAFGIMRDMGDKLDADVLRAFQVVITDST